ncbi:MAG: hypothetical protein HY033_10600 [Ignavibacteriae bacterium]|nr:hypothetical protein [Ignavibacteria bacterium]MBI3365347.1 hypothetical protein [Ignavibacteriota bacterium]
MRLTHLFVALALSMFMMACAGSLRYSSDYPLRSETFRSRDSAFSGRVPQGWFASSDDSLAPAFVAWLIRDDFSATLAVRELLLDQLTVKHIRKEGLNLLARIDVGLRENTKDKQSGFVVEPKIFEIGGRKFCSYELMEGTVKTRVVVFEAKEKYYECEAKPSKEKWTQEDLMLLFTAQQTFLSALIF